MTSAAVFPGQGSQYIGMGLELIERHPEINDILELADSVVDYQLSELMASGPKEELDDTLNAQPSIFVVSHIYWRLLKMTGWRPDYLAGHSLGELSACLAADVFSFETGLQIVQRRAELMSLAAASDSGGMLAVIGLSDDKVVEVAAAVGLQPANYNCPGQMVVAGPSLNLDHGGDAFKSAGAKKVVRLAVSGAFHSPAMAVPAKRFAAFLENIPMADPQIPIISNSTAEPLLTAADVKHALSSQLVSPVKWRQCVNRLIDRGVAEFVEVGPGRVLSGLIKRISGEVKIGHAIDRLSSA